MKIFIIVLFLGVATIAVPVVDCAAGETVAAVAMQPITEQLNADRASTAVGNPQQKAPRTSQGLGGINVDSTTKDKYGGLKISRFDDTGFFRLENTRGRWFLVTPEGHPFYLIGLNSVTPWFARYRDTSYVTKYREKFRLWANVALDRVYWLGFNTIAYQTTENIIKQMIRGTVWKMPFTMLIPFVSPNSVKRTEFPDVFSADFHELVDQKAKEYCEPLKNEPFLVGYFLGNELDFNLNLGPQIDWRSRWVKTLLQQRPGTPARKQLKTILEKMFGSIEKLNMEFKGAGTHFTSFDEVGFKQIWPAYKKKVTQAVRIVEAYNALIAKEYYRATTEAIRKYDGNHLILGSRFGTNAEPKVLSVIKEYTDVVSFNRYSEGGQFPSTTYDKMYSQTNKPLFHTEFSFLEEGRTGPYPSAPDQRTRGRYYSEVVSRIAEDDRIIGFAWHGMIDPNEDTNFGFIDIHDEFYYDMIPYVMQANRSVKARFAELLTAKIKH